MKKQSLQVLIGILILLLIFHPAFGQVSFMNNAPLPPKALNYEYDSLTNFRSKKNGDNYSYHHLIGQTIVFCGAPYFTDDNYGCEIGEYYKIDSILPDNPIAGLYNRLLVTNIKTHKQINFGDLTYSGHYNRKFVVVGHIEKLKSLYVGHEFIYVGCVGIYDYFHKQDHLISVETDEMTRDVEKESIWECVDVRVKPRSKEDRMDTEERSPVVLVFDNPKYGKHYCYFEGQYGYPILSYNSEEQPLLCGLFTDKVHHEELLKEQNKKQNQRISEMVKKYGATNGNLIAQGIVRIGMTKAMCKDAWGEPIDIHTTKGAWGVHEQWVYGDNTFLYFENGKLTSIQD